MKMNTWIVRGTSRRTGAIVWLRADATPTSHRSEAGRFAYLNAAGAIEEYQQSEHCRWTFEILPADAQAVTP